MLIRVLAKNADVQGGLSELAFDVNSVFQVTPNYNEQNEEEGCFVQFHHVEEIDDKLYVDSSYEDLVEEINQLRSGAKL